MPDFEIPYHVDIMERLGGIDLESARKVAGNGFTTWLEISKASFGSYQLCKGFYD